MGDVARDVTARFRYNVALPIAAFVALCGAVPLTAAGWPFAFVLLVPFAIMVWGLRAGVDVRGGRLVVRWALGSRTVDPARIRGFTITHRRVSAVLADDSAVWLPAVPGTRVPVLAEAVGLQVAGAAEPDGADAEQTGTGDGGSAAHDAADAEAVASDAGAGDAGSPERNVDSRSETPTRPR